LGKAVTLVAADRLDTALTGVPGYEVYGRHTGAAVVVSIKAPAPIGANTTIWLNTDLDVGTGYKVWGFAAGAEFNVNVGVDGIPRLHTGGAGEILISTLEYAYTDNGLTIEVPTALIGNPPSVAVYIDVNDAVFLPNDYSIHVWRITRSAGVTVPGRVSRPVASGVVGR
jgi:serralysin